MIQNDQIRQTCLNKWGKANPGGSVNDGIKATTREASKAFMSALSDKLISLSKKKAQDLQVIYLDKNFPPEQINVTIASINAHARGSEVQVKKVALVPQIETRYKDYPFSLTFLIQCFNRCLERNGHLTMPNDDPCRLAKLIILFFQAFNGTKLDAEF